MPLLDIHDIGRNYGPLRALYDVTLALEPGTIGLVGNNGAGKSTLLKILLGLLKPDSGGGTILGCDLLHSSSDLRGRIGYMSESAAIVPVLRGVEFVALAGDLYGMPHRDARRRAHEVLNYVGLGELRYRRLEEYSTGNLQRLKLAAALVHDPELLLLDEPTNGLDPAGRVAMLELLGDLIAETGKSVILCTHLLGDVERLCRQIVVLDRGTIVRAGTIEDLRGDAGNRYELGWDGPREPFAAALRTAGAELSGGASSGGASSGGASSGGNGGRAIAAVPASWTTLEFFRIAAASGVTLRHLRLDEENLERFFLRITGNAERETPSAQREEVAEENR
jgi:ABC-2 type transport system ATP-binding protein